MKGINCLRARVERGHVGGSGRRVGGRGPGGGSGGGTFCGESKKGIASGLGTIDGSQSVTMQSRRRMLSMCLRIVVPSGNLIMYDNGPVTSAISPESHFGDFPVKFSANTESPTWKLLNCLVESCDCFCFVCFCSTL